MKSDKHKELLPRDAALARLLAEALESKAAGDAQAFVCPDAEILAAYAEHGLSEQEASRWEVHIADCGRCQQIIAGVVVSRENLESAKLSEQGIVAPAPVPMIRKPAPQRGARGPGFWRWWVPGLGLAAAVALWFAFHPAIWTRPASPSAAVTTAPSPGGPGGEQGNSPAATTKPEETQMAEAKVPPPPGGVSAAAGRSGSTLRDSDQLQANAPADALKRSVGQGSLQNGGQSSGQNEGRRERQTAAQAASALDADRAARAPEAPADKDAEQRSEAADRKKESVVVTGEAPAVAAAAPAPQLAPPSAAPAAPPAAAPQQSSGASGTFAPRAKALASNQMQALAKAITPPLVFGPPDHSVLWRVGPGGLIESSSDDGQNWRAQASGVTADLLAGAATSAKIAWAAGRGGIIVRTEDGEHWQRVMPPALGPEVATPDWVGIEASDELHATVTSRDRHRYATADGGKTWVPQP